MSWWTALIGGTKALLGIGAGAATANPLSVAKAGAEMVTELGKDKREADHNSIEGKIAAEKKAGDAAIDAAVDRAKGGAAAMLLGGLLLALSFSGCASPPSRDSAPSTGNVESLLRREDFTPAAKAAPEWVRDALKRLNSVEADLQRERARANQVP